MEGGDDQDKTASVHSVDEGRRRISKAAIATPVLMSLASQPVLARGRECTPSAFASANPSRPVDFDTCRGCSPGYWHIGVCWPLELDSKRHTPFHAAFGYERDAYDGYTYPHHGNGYPSKQEILDVLDKPLIEFFPSTGLGSNALAKFVRAALAAMLNGYHAGVPFWSDADADMAKSLMTTLFPPAPMPGTYATADNHTLLRHASNWATWWDEGTEVCVLPGHGRDCPDD